MSKLNISSEEPNLKKANMSMATRNSPGNRNSFLFILPIDFSFIFVFKVLCSGTGPYWLVVWFPDLNKSNSIVSMWLVANITDRNLTVSVFRANTESVSATNKEKEVT